MAGRLRVAVLLAPLGVLVGHGGGYALAATSAREPLHGYLSATAWVAAGLALAAAVHVLRRPADSIGPSSALRLGGLQVLGFLAMETAERGFAGTDFHSLMTDRAVWAGLAAQLVVALVLARLVRAAARLLVCGRGGVGARNAPVARIRGSDRTHRQVVVPFARLRRGPPAGSLPLTI